MLQGVGCHLRLPIQLSAQALSVLINLHGTLCVLISHIYEFSQGPHSDIVPRAQHTLRCMIFPGATAAVRSQQAQRLDLGDADIQQRMQARLLAVAQIYIFINTFLGYVVPMYIGYLHELRDKLQWLQQRQQQQQEQQEGSSASAVPRTWHGTCKRGSCLHHIAVLQLLMAAHRGRWVRAMLLHYLMLHGAAALCWGMSHLAARPVLLMFGCSLA